jgi:hypothetical protein
MGTDATSLQDRHPPSHSRDAKLGGLIKLLVAARWSDILLGGPARFRAADHE